ncbi:porin [Mergibacter septicus]|uniref:Porin n=1 Tax=Mergibacter septicus TaxID=221402 RepID=A0A8E3S8R1_9PAST|nr:porin [Mergibacter septicus]AWX15508.1 porin [Mergibacter septicus]QDJ14762.1 porin [Mergibacter septicus]UTU47809.1 porin [Mergibacter septicus]
MKKTLVALAVAALAATSANAAVVYNQDGTKLDINGSVRVLLNKNTKTRANLGNDGSRINFSAKQDLGNGLSALGYVRLKIDGDNASKLSVNKLYAGLGYDGVGTLTLGKQNTTADDVALGDYTYKWGGNSTLTTDGEKVAKFRSADFAGFSFGADYLVGNKEKGGAGLKQGYGVSAFYTANFADDVTLKANAGYTTQKNILATDADKQAEAKVKTASDVNDIINAVKLVSNKSKSWLVATELTSGPVSVGVSYGQAKLNLGATVENEIEEDLKVKAFLVGANYKVTDAARVYAQYNRTTANGGKLNGYALGTGYKLHKNVETFLEVARFKASEHKANNLVGVGFRVNF